MNERRRHRPALLVLAFLIAAPAVSAAAPIVGGTATYDFDNTFTVRLLPGTPFNPGPDPVDLAASSSGAFTQVWQQQVGFTIQDELTSVVQTGELTPPVGPPVPYTILGGIDEVPELGPFVGSITGIVQDPNSPGFDSGDPSSLVSGFRQVGGPFAQILNDGSGAFLYSQDSYFFEGSVTSLPFAVGQQFVGTRDVEIKAQTGATIDPVNDPVVGVVLAGGIVEITAIPEPQLPLALLTLLGLVALRRR